MTNTEGNEARSTQFEGFAHLLIKELEDENRAVCIGDAGKVREMIACRAYDLVRHACEEISDNLVSLYPDKMIESIPDMAEWPDEASQ